MAYRFHRLPAPGWDLFIAYPELGEQHRVAFPTAGITPANRYQLLMFLGESANIVVDQPDNTVLEFAMSTGSTSLDAPVNEFMQGSMWKETPSVSGHVRMCISPAGARRRWLREIREVSANEQINLQPNSVAVYLTGNDYGEYVYGSSFTSDYACRVLIASFP